MIFEIKIVSIFLLNRRLTVLLYQPNIVLDLVIISNFRRNHILFFFLLVITRAPRRPLTIHGRPFRLAAEPSLRYFHSYFLARLYQEVVSFLQKVDIILLPTLFKCCGFPVHFIQTIPQLLDFASKIPRC